MKNILKVLLVFTIVLCTCGCTDKYESISAKEFYERFNKNYELVDVSQSFDFLVGGYAFANEDIEFYFYEGERTFDIGNIYKDEVNNAKSLLDDDMKDNIENDKNYSKIIMFDDKYYYTIMYLDKTLLYAKSSIKNKDKVFEIFETCGY